MEMSLGQTKKKVRRPAMVAFCKHSDMKKKNKMMEKNTNVDKRGVQRGALCRLHSCQICVPVVSLCIKT
jgi:hypothetical protein